MGLQPCLRSLGYPRETVSVGFRWISVGWSGSLYDPCLCQPFYGKQNLCPEKWALSKGWKSVYEKGVQRQVSKGKQSLEEEVGKLEARKTWIRLQATSTKRSQRPQAAQPRWAAAEGGSQLEQTMSEIQQHHQRKSRKKWGTGSMSGDGKQKQSGRLSNRKIAFSKSL